MSSQAARTFDHQACLYGSDRQFLEMALPFLETGLANGEPVLAVTTPANLELIGSALGTRADDVDYAESAFFGRRPPQRIAAFHRYAQRHAPGTGRRPGTHPRRTGLDRTLRAGDCGVEADGVSAQCRTGRDQHPHDLPLRHAHHRPGHSRLRPPYRPGAGARAGRHPEPGLRGPGDLRERVYRRPLPEPPDGAAAFEFNGNLRSLRQFVASRAAAHGLAGDQADLLVQAAGEVGTYLKYLDPGHVAVRTWEQAGAVMCDFSQPATSFRDPFLGLRPAGLKARPGDGLWLTGQICDWMDISSGIGGGTIRLQVPGKRDQETAQQGVRYPA